MFKKYGLKWPYKKKRRLDLVGNIFSKVDLRDYIFFVAKQINISIGSMKLSAVIGGTPEKIIMWTSIEGAFLVITWKQKERVFPKVNYWQLYNKGYKFIYCVFNWVRFIKLGTYTALTQTKASIENESAFVTPSFSQNATGTSEWKYLIFTQQMRL